MNVAIEDIVTAADKGDHKKIEYLLMMAPHLDLNSNDKDGRNALTVAASKGHVKVMETLFDRSADPNTLNGKGYSALGYAVSQSKIGAVKMLIKRGANTNHRAENDLSLLEDASWQGQADIVNALIDGGADINAGGRCGYSPLHRACHTLNPNIFVVPLLIERGANVNAKNDFGQTPLHDAAQEGNIGAVAYLLNSGADVDILDKHGETALGNAAMKKHRAVVKLLLRYDADPNARGTRGKSPLERAEAAGDIDIIKILLAHGADPDSKDAYGVSFRSQATWRKRTDLLELITTQPIGINKSHRSYERQKPAEEKSVVQPKYIAELVNELTGLTGLVNIKTEVVQLVNFLRIQQMRKQRGLSVPEQSLHMVFTGNPGTGKTTIARLIAQIYKSMGILSGGQFIETDRVGLIGGYLGQTGIKTQKIVESALGGVLFIDEAYSLTEDTYGRDMYGQEAVATLLKMMEDHRDDLIVIVAGYTEPMQKFIRSNPGLQSRFNKFLHFDDYAPDELTEIFKHFAAQGDYKLHPATELKLHNVFADLYAHRDETFGNARLARNMFEKAINAHANRMVSAEAVDEVSLVTLYPEDVPNG